MKKLSLLLLVPALVLFSFGCNNILEVELDAQTFPAAVHVEMDAPPVSDQVIGMNVSLDNGTPVFTPLVVTTCSVVGSPVLSPCLKSTPFNIPDALVHVATVTLINAFGNSTAVNISFKGAVPAKASNATVKGGTQ